MTRPINPTLNNDVLQEVFRRLPVKRLAQCKRISKHWNNVISQPRFTVEKGRSNEPNRTLLTYPGSVIVYPRHKGFDSINRAKPWCFDAGVRDNSVIVGTCDGLICFSPSKTGKHALVMNPASKDIQTCKFEPTRNRSFSFGFGFDDASNDYKVVKITRCKEETYVEIHNLYTKVASVTVLSQSQVSFQLTSAAPVTVNGHSHWIGMNLENHKLEIVRFDFKSEKFVNIPFSNDMPNIKSGLNIENIVGDRPSFDLEVEGLKFRLGVFEGSVCLLVSRSTKVEIWCMKYKNCSVWNWNKQFEIEYRDTREVIGFSANNELVSGEKIEHYFACNPWTNKTIFPMGIGPYCLNQVVTYQESLVPVKVKPIAPTE